MIDTLRSTELRSNRTVGWQKTAELVGESCGGNGKPKFLIQQLIFYEYMD